MTEPYQKTLYANAIIALVKLRVFCMFLVIAL